MEQVKSFLVIYEKANGVHTKRQYPTLDKATKAFKAAKAKYAAAWLIAGSGTGNGNKMLDSFER